MKTKVDKTIINNVRYILETIYNGVLSKDKDCIRSHMEDLTYYLDEKGLMGD